MREAQETTLRENTLNTYYADFFQQKNSCGMRYLFRYVRVRCEIFQITEVTP